MDAESLTLHIAQPQLFEYGESTIGTLELFPIVWGGCEDLVSSDTALRSRGLEKLLALGAPRLSPLVAYLLATRLNDPYLSLRKKVVYAVGDLFTFDEHGLAAPESVRRAISTVLAQMRMPGIQGILEVADDDPATQLRIARLLNACPYAGQFMAEMLTDRKMLMELRYRAVQFISLVGYLDAIPTLERMESRLETRLVGQQAMPFAPVSEKDETLLLPAIRAALAALREP